MCFSVVLLFLAVEVCFDLFLTREIDFERRTVADFLLSRLVMAASDFEEMEDLFQVGLAF